MPPKRGSSQLTQNKNRKRVSRDNASSEEEESDQETSTQFIKQKEDVIKDCLVSLLSRNSTLLPIKANDIFSKFGEKIGRKDRVAIINTLKAKLQEIGACLRPIEGNKYLIVNQLPRNPLLQDEFTSEKQLLCLILCLIAVNKGTIKKSELEKNLEKLGINLVNADPYFGNVTKLVQLFERQCYLKKSPCHKESNQILYEWGIRAQCEVEKDDIANCIALQLADANGTFPQVNLSIITPPEEDIEETDDN